MKVFQTGGTGYVGSVVANELLAAGHMVTGLAQSEETAARLKTMGIAAVVGDLADEALIQRAARDADGVIHQAMRPDNKAGEADRAAVRAILAGLAGTHKPFVYTSGLWVLGSTGDKVADESAPVNPIPMVAFRPAGEQQTLTAPNIRGIVIRPANAYGRGGGIIALMMQWARRDGVVKYIGTGENRWPMVHVDDLAVLYVQALEKAPRGSLLHGCSTTGIKVREIVGAIARAMGMPGKTRSWSYDDARQALDGFADALALDLQASGTAAQRLLGWKPTGPSLLDDIEHGSYARLRAGMAM